MCGLTKTLSKGTEREQICYIMNDALNSILLLSVQKNYYNNASPKMMYEVHNRVISLSFLLEATYDSNQ